MIPSRRLMVNFVNFKTKKFAGHRDTKRILAKEFHLCLGAFVANLFGLSRSSQNADVPYIALAPPSTINVWPVTKSDAWEQKNKTGSAISAGSAILPAGTVFTICS